MKSPRRQPSARSAAGAKQAGLRVRLAEAEETLRAIRSGEVDAVVVSGKQGPQVFTLEGAERAYRVLIESMNEGALTLKADQTILYANECFARMIKCPLEQVTGSSFHRFLSADDRSKLRPLLKRGVGRSGAKIQVMLKALDGSPMPAQVSLRPLGGSGSNGATAGMVVTDMTEARRTEELLRALAHRVVQGQETERANVALELHDHITQQLIAVLFSSQALADKLSDSDGPAKHEAEKLRRMLAGAVDEVERISRDLRPGALELLGLETVLRSSCTEFADRTGAAVKLACTDSTARLPANIELALFRIFQEALKNVAKHARARHVTVALRRRPGAFVQLVINDDGIGFDAKHHAARRNGNAILSLLSMRERAAYVGGALTVKSGRGAGTEIGVRIPLPTAPDPDLSHSSRS